jgi:hypothetical protein
MTSSSFPRAPSHLQKKTVQVLLRGGRSLEGTIHIPEGLPLLNFLGGKRYFLNLTSVRKTGAPAETEAIDHLSLRLSNLVWVIPMEGTLHVSNAASPTDSSRTVELQLVDGLTLSVDLEVAEEQRMSDYLDANPGFMPLWSARIISEARTIERLAVNQEAILAIREVSMGIRPEG